MDIISERLAGPRIDALPSVTKFQYLILMPLVMGYFFEFYHFNIAPYVMDVLAKEWGMDAVMIGVVMASSAWGMVVGALTGGVVSDIFGRRINFIWALVVYSAFSFLNGFAGSPLEMIIYRAVAGWGVGAQTDAITTYLQEFFPSRMRGKITSIAFGLGVAPAQLGDALVFMYVGTPYGWPWMFWIGGIGGVLVYLLQVMFLPESPRWLQVRGRWDEAERILQKIESQIPVGKVEQHRRDVEELAAKALYVPTEKERVSPRDLLNREYRKRTLVIWQYFALNYLAVHAMGMWVTVILIRAFGPVVGTTQLIIGRAGFITGSLLAAPLSDRMGRKRLLGVGLVCYAFFMVVFGLVVDYWPIATIIAICALLFYTPSGFTGSQGYIYAVEQHPTRARATAFATGTAWARVGTSVGPIILGYLMTTMMLYQVFSIVAIIQLACSAMILLFGVSTKGKTLEELAK